MKRVLSTDLTELATQKGLYSGGYSIAQRLSSGLKSSDQKEKEKRLKDFRDLAIAASKRIPLPLVTKKEALRTESIDVLMDVNDSDYIARPSMAIEGINLMKNHVKIIEGRMFSDKRTGSNEYEVIVSEKAKHELSLRLDVPYKMGLSKEEFTGKPFFIRVVGVYTYKEASDPFWGDRDWQYPETLIMDYKLFEKDFMMDEEVALDSIRYFYAYNREKIDVEKLNKIIEPINADYKSLREKDIDSVFLGKQIIESYMGKAKELNRMLWILQVPVIVMLLLYISMVSSLIVEQDKNEIAVMKSRGGKSYQILFMYFLQSTVMGGVALLLGPPLGVYMCKLIGAANGFLQFVQRSPLKVQLTPNEYLYSLVAVLLFIITMMIPVMRASRTTIVQYKQSKVKFNEVSFWKKYYLDLIFTGIVAYGLYIYSKRQLLIQNSAVKIDMPFDPIMYIMSTLFVLAVGLIFLRIYPYIIRFIFWLFKKLWSPAIYTSLVNVGRSDGKSQFLMIFLILTIAIGIFNVKAAGSINGNVEEQIRYITGAPIVLETEQKLDKEGRPDITINMLGKVSKINGIDSATKVFVTDNVELSLHTFEVRGVHVMGVVPDEFGKIAWFSNRLFDYSWTEYLNYIAKEPSAVIVSEQFKKKYAARLGDKIFISCNDGLPMEFFIGAFVKYWPGVDLSDERASLIVTNLQSLEKKSLAWPYQIWASKKSANSSEAILKGLNENEIKLQKWLDVDQSLIKIKNNATLQGINGTLTLGFITTMLITIMGFLIYWLLAIKSRTLQFGILRAMGLSFRKLIGVLINEQILISGVAILVGIVLGEIDANMFVPLTQMNTNIGNNLLPFRIIASRGDYINFFIICSSMLIFGLVVLIRAISRIKIDQAIKLGED